MRRRRTGSPWSIPGGACTSRRGQPPAGAGQVGRQSGREGLRPAPAAGGAYLRGDRHRAGPGRRRVDLGHSPRPRRRVPAGRRAGRGRRRASVSPIAAVAPGVRVGGTTCGRGAGTQSRTGRPGSATDQARWPRTRSPSLDDRVRPGASRLPSVPDGSGREAAADGRRPSRGGPRPPADPGDHGECGGAGRRRHHRTGSVRSSTHLRGPFPHGRGRRPRGSPGRGGRCRAGRCVTPGRRQAPAARLGVRDCPDLSARRRDQGGVPVGRPPRRRRRSGGPLAPLGRALSGGWLLLARGAGGAARAVGRQAATARLDPAHRRDGARPGRGRASRSSPGSGSGRPAAARSAGSCTTCCAAGFGTLAVVLPVLFLAAGLHLLRQLPKPEERGRVGIGWAALALAGDRPVPPRQRPARRPGRPGRRRRPARRLDRRPAAARGRHRAGRAAAGAGAVLRPAGGDQDPGEPDPAPDPGGPRPAAAPAAGRRPAPDGGRPGPTSRRPRS